MKYCRAFLFWLSFLAWRQCLTAYPHDEHVSKAFPSSEEEYMKERDILRKEEKAFEGRGFAYTQDELVADRYLSYLKWLHFEDTRTTGLPASLPIELNLESIEASPVYKALFKLPKGGNLHSHEDHQLSKRKLFEIVWESSDFAHLYIVDPRSGHADACTMDFFVNPPEDKPWKKVQDLGLTVDDVLLNNTLINLLTPQAYNTPTSSGIRWNLINFLWSRASTQLISNIEIKRPYLKALMEQSVAEGVTYIESRRSFGLDLDMYELDHSGGSSENNGKKYFDETGEMEVKVAMEVEEQIKQLHPHFMGFKRISYTVRSLSDELFQKVYKTTLNLHQKYPNHVIGFDAVAEEDGGFSTLHFIDEYLGMSDAAGGSQIPLYLHTAETNWPDDLMSSTLSDDLTSTLENAYDALLLKAKRLGHGKGYLKKPYLRKLLKLTSTAVEVCPLSNQILGIDPDLRNHFGQVLHKEGVPIVLAPDDPGTFGFDNFTLDWYAAYTSWGLELGDLKKIALNSLTYSGMSDLEKPVAISKWEEMWQKYVEDLKSEACGTNFDETETRFIRVLPSSGSPGVKIHIYGRHFERAMCEQVFCRLDNEQSFEGTYVSYQEVMCKVPELQTETGSHKLSVSFTGSTGPFVDTGLTFGYHQKQHQNSHFA